MFEKLVSFTKKVADLPDRPSLNPGALKAQFDAAPDEVRVHLNKLIDALKLTTTGDSGAKNIGATNIPGLTGSDVQTLLEQLANLYAKKAQPGYNILVLQNGWNGTGNGDSEPRYFKDEFGRVQIKGEIWGGAIADWTIVATLPVGYKPYERLWFSVTNSDGGTSTKAVYVVIETDGTIKTKNLAWNNRLSLNIPAFMV